jgi:hypothetical protein
LKAKIRREEVRFESSKAAIFYLAFGGVSGVLLDVLFGSPSRLFGTFERLSEMYVLSRFRGSLPLAEERKK